MPNKEQPEEIIDAHPDVLPEQDFSELIKQENVLNYPILIGSTIRGGKILGGSGNKCFKFEEDKGIWLGNATFSSAPFRVNMEGDVVANSILINGRSGQTIADAINASGNLITDLINARLDTSAKQILDAFTFGTSGAIQIGTYVNGTSGDIRISPNGIVGRDSSGANTFTIDGTTGNATFKGEVAAGSVISADISADRITTGTLTGRTIQTAPTNNFRLEMRQTGEADYPNELVWYSSTNAVLARITRTVQNSYDLLGLVGKDGTMVAENTWGTIIGLGAGSQKVDIEGNVILEKTATATSTTQYSSYALKLIGSVWDTTNAWAEDRTFTIQVNAGSGADGAEPYQLAFYDNTGNNVLVLDPRLKVLFPPQTNSDLGSSTYYWNNLYLNYLRFNSSYGQIYWGTDLVFDFYSAEVLINKNLKPAAGLSLGYSAERWANIYGTNIYCTNQTADKHITGDLHFKDLFRVDEDKNYLRFWNKKGQLIMKLSQDGELYVNKIIQKNLG